MQVTQTLAEGLKRQFKVVIPAADLGQRFDSEIDQLRGKVNLNGFRPGKVPAAHLRRLYGKSVMADVIQSSVNDANKKIVDDHELRLAAEPQVTFPEDQAVIEKVLNGEADLDFAVDLEILPEVEIKDHTGLALTRETAKVEESEIDSAIERMAAARRPFTPRGDQETAAAGDRVTIDFVGTMQGEAFPGGSGTDVNLVLGSGQFIPGFEDQLVGARKGEQRQVNVRFPDTYQAVDLAGKEAVFAVTVKAVAAPGELAIDDEFAKSFGLDTVEKLRDALRASLQQELDEQARLKVKRRLLDALDAVYDFDLPPSMLEQEFSVVWQQIMTDMQRSGQSFGPGEEEETRAEYRKIAARRVRLGLVLAAIGEKISVKITDKEITDAIVERARQFPGQEKQVFEYYRKNPEAIADLRAPLIEEKVVDYLLGIANVAETPVSREVLFADPDAEPAEAATPEKPKKAKATKKAAETSAGTEAGAAE
ncbi:MAG: trigger factor [Hyphomicrobiales bacterium]|uniref:trigger factor n=1 Tax=Rhabdaerophilum calidifontis TaxID=2604328 RepID=UPI0012391466|nr:trigger factor [Rhabdaerophilum calidifontis]MCA2000029.1 trigger factor [Hyphomicrobiales bacterium]